MSKTMENDYSSYSREDLKDEIERLKAELNTEIVKGRIDLRDERDSLRADNERLKAERDNWQETARVEHNANHTLRARVEELEKLYEDMYDDYRVECNRATALEAENNRNSVFWKRMFDAEYKGRLEVSKERDALRARVEELEAELKYDHEEYKRLRDALRAECQAVKVSRQISEDTATRVIEGLRAELEQIKQGENMAKHPPDFDKEIPAMVISNLKAENARLKNNIEGLNYTIDRREAELAALKPVAVLEFYTKDDLEQFLKKLKIEMNTPAPMPNIVKRRLFVTTSSGYTDPEGSNVNMEVTFTDGKLTGVEII